MKNFKSLFELDKKVSFLNHGSFGATPKAILRKSFEIEKEMEKEPVKFLVRDYEDYYEKARESLSQLVFCDKDDLAFVTNATTGVNIALRSFPLSRGDEVIVTNMEYNACRNALNWISVEKGVSVREIKIPFPVNSFEEILSTLLNAVTKKTRLLLIDHIVSPTAIILDVETIVKRMKEVGVETIVDGAHSIGQVPLNLKKIDPAYFVSNCHKWLMTPKGSAFLYARKEFQDKTHPLVISHWANTIRKDKSRFTLEFLWCGTFNPSSIFVIPYAIDYFKSIYPEGIEGIMKRNRDLCLKAREMLLKKLKVEKPCPDEMVGAMASIPISDAKKEPIGPLFIDELQDELFFNYKIEVPIIYFPQYPKRLVRISVQIYNKLNEYKKLGEILKSRI